MDNETEQIFLVNTAHNPPPSEPHRSQLEAPTVTQVNLENVADFSSVCRTCAAITQFLIPVFEGEGLVSGLAHKIHKHLPIQMCADDVLPRAVCYQCAHTLLAWHELAACCRQADAALRTRLANMQRHNEAAQAQAQQPTTSEEAQTTKNAEQTESMPCRSNFENLENAEYKLAMESDDEDCIDRETLQSSDDEPLSTLASKKSNDLYNNFYTALLNFRNHFATDHNKHSYPDFTESSDAEIVETNTDLEDFDDLTHSNMRKDRMDDATRLELSQVQSRINGKVYYSCTICGKNLSSVHTYVFHKRIHTGERPCVCHVCGKQFRAPNGLQRHITETHEKLRRHACRYCTKNFANSQNLKQHLRIHTGERPYVCPQCGKRFTQSGSLHVHLKTHSEQFPHCCAECGAKFRLRSGLARHRLKHTGERPHVCHCGKGFRQRHELNNHRLSHSDAKPFGCGVCGATFRQRRALAHHSKRLHDTEQDLGPRSSIMIYTNIGQYQ